LRFMQPAGFLLRWQEVYTCPHPAPDNPGHTVPSHLLHTEKAKMYKTANSSKDTKTQNSMRGVDLYSTVPRQTLGPVEPSF
jgi:hypothetical protein